MATLYATSPATRFFYIPDDAVIPEGTLVLRTITGKERKVDPAVVEAFAVSEEEAKRITSEDMKRIVGNVGNMLRQAGSVLADVGKIQRGAKDLSKGDPEAEKRVADALGVTPEQLHNDPAAVKAGLEQAMAGIKATIAQAASDKPADEEVVRERMQKLAKAAADNGFPELQGPIEEIPAKLREILADPSILEDIKAATARLREEAERLRAESRAAPEDKPPVGEA